MVIVLQVAFAFNYSAFINSGYLTILTFPDLN